MSYFLLIHYMWFNFLHEYEVFSSYATHTLFLALKKLLTFLTHLQASLMRIPLFLNKNVTLKRTWIPRPTTSRVQRDWPGSPYSRQFMRNDDVK